MKNKAKSSALFLFCVILLTCIISCMKSSTQLVKVSYFTDNAIKKITEAVLIKKENKGGVIYSYYDTVVTDTSMIMEIAQLNDEKFIEFNGVRCNRIGKNQFTVKGITWEINKYLFDKDDVQDEELILFFNELYGVIVLYSEPWLIYKTYEVDSCSATLSENILRDEIDVLGFKLPKPTGNPN